MKKKMASPSFGKDMIHLGYRKMAKSHCPRLSTTCPCDTVPQSPSSLQPTPVTRPCTIIIKASYYLFWLILWILFFYSLLFTAMFSVTLLSIMSFLTISFKVLTGLLPFPISLNMWPINTLYRGGCSSLNVPKPLQTTSSWPCNSELVSTKSSFLINISTLFVISTSQPKNGHDKLHFQP